jgi:hypothetical protein
MSSLITRDTSQSCVVLRGYAIEVRSELKYPSALCRRISGVTSDEVKVLPPGFRAVDYGRLGLPMTEITVN